MKMENYEKTNVVVTIPVYRETLSADEERSFRRSCAVYGKKYSVVAFAPESVDMAVYVAIFPDLKIERFPDSYFRSIGDYSRLLLSEEFYERFADFEWLLICQLDVWVFRDELEYWCSCNIDFLGAPIPARHDPGIKRDSDLYVSGNGGFSLRKISATLDVLRAGNVKMYTLKQLFSFFLNHLRSGDLIKALIPLGRMMGINNSREHCLRMLGEQGACEDMVFRLLFFAKISPYLTFASVETASKFALDGGSVWRFFNQTSHIPSALHAWHRDEGREFMKFLEERHCEDVRGSFPEKRPT